MPFRCDHCARCCRHHVVPVTGEDVARLRAHTTLPPSAFLQLRSPLEVDMEGEPESLALLPEGDFVVALAQNGDGACTFLQKEADGRETCSVHAKRPTSCRAYPFDRPTGASDDLGLHPGALCPPETGYLSVLSTHAARDEWIETVRERDRALRRHAEWLARWNQRQRLRRRMGKPRLSAADLLQALSELSFGASTGDAEEVESAVATKDATDVSQVACTEQVDVHE